jgi:hypothetical protein
MSHVSIFVAIFGRARSLVLKGVLCPNQRGNGDSRSDVWGGFRKEQVFRGEKGRFMRFSIAIVFLSLTGIGLSASLAAQTTILPSEGGLLEFLLLQNEAARARIDSAAYTVRYGKEYDRGRGKKRVQGSSQLKFSGKWRWELEDFKRSTEPGGVLEHEAKSSVVVNDEYVGLHLEEGLPAYVFMHERIEKPNPEGQKWPETQNQTDVLDLVFGSHGQSLREYLAPDPVRAVASEERDPNDGHVFYRITVYNSAYSVDPKDPDSVFLLDPEKDFLITQAAYFNKGGGLWLNRTFELSKVRDAQGRELWFPARFEEARHGKSSDLDKAPAQTEVQTASVVDPEVNISIPPEQFELGTLTADFDQPIIIWEIDGTEKGGGYIDGRIVSPLDAFYALRDGKGILDTLATEIPARSDVEQAPPQPPKQSPESTILDSPLGKSGASGAAPWRRSIVVTSVVAVVAILAVLLKRAVR